MNDFCRVGVPPQIWIDTAKKVVSFHAMDGYQRMGFENRDFFWDYIDELMEHHYKFQ